jgi:hypothetical protein
LAYDGLYAFLFAIDELLSLGHQPGEIRQDLLLEAVSRQTFEGMSKVVRFEDGKRPGDWAIENLIDNGQGGFAFPMVAKYAGGELLWESGTSVTWRGDLGDVNPVDRQERCSENFFRSEESFLCQRCEVGTYLDELVWKGAVDPEKEVCVPNSEESAASETNVRGGIATFCATLFLMYAMRMGSKKNMSRASIKTRAMEIVLLFFNIST